MAMNKFNILTSITALLQDVKDPKVFLLRTLSALVLIISYLVVTNQSEFLDFIKNFSRSTVVEQVRAEKAIQYPRVAKEKAAMLYVQATADAVFITEYTPKFINNYQEIVAWEGRLNINPSKLVTKSVIDKTSNVYQKHLVGKSYSVDISSAVVRGTFITNASEYTSLGIKYMYTCPIFNLDSSYSGYIGIAYRDNPYTTDLEKVQLEGYLERICEPQARVLGRSK